MKLGLDISQIVYEGTGVGRFTSGLLRTIFERDHENKWIFFFSSLRQRLNPQIEKSIKESGHRLVEYRLPPAALSFLWNRMHRMKIEKLTGKLDWFITSDWTEGPSRMNKATVIHDLVYLRYPDTVHPLIRATQESRMKWVKKESKVIFADSQSTKDDIVELLGIDGKRVYVNYPGLEQIHPNAKNNPRVLARFNLAKPFILTVGKIEPRKNLKRLLEAYGRLKDDSIDLVVVGSQGWDTETSKEKSGGKNIRFLSYVNEDELWALYASCLFFIYPSLYEGFGYPVVEAMAAGAAVATSNVSSLREIGEGNALLFDPLETDDIEMAMRTLRDDDKLRDKFKKQGIMKSRQYGWGQYFDTMMNVLMNAR